MSDTPPPASPPPPPPAPPAGGPGYPDDHADLLARVRRTYAGSRFDPADGVEVLRRYGAPVPAGARPDVVTLAGKLADANPQQFPRYIGRATDPAERAALARRLAELEADPATDARPFAYNDAAGREKKITWAEHQAWRATPGRTHVVEDEAAGYDADRERRTVGPAKRKGDVIPGVGVVADARHDALGGRREYLVRPFTKKEKAEDDARRKAAAAATAARDAVPYYDRLG